MSYDHDDEETLGLLDQHDEMTNLERNFGYELTGLEEHLRDEAWECGELAAMRREAEQEARMEGEMQAAYEEQMWEEQQADPLRAVCWNGPSPECLLREDDNIPF